MKSKKRVDFTVDSELFKRFKEYCKLHNIKMSNVIENLIKSLIGQHTEEEHKEHLKHYTG